MLCALASLGLSRLNPALQHLCLPSSLKLSLSLLPQEGKGKDYEPIKKGDVVIFPAFGATVQEMKYFKVIFSPSLSLSLSQHLLFALFGLTDLGVKTDYF